MPHLERDGASIYYEVHGTGFPLLLAAPGGMRSQISWWGRAPWHPIEHLRPHFRVIAMDQRNSGKSSGPIRASDGWHTYLDDQVALADHLGLKRFHFLGMCIGGSFGLGLMDRLPDRVASAVLMQPIGLEGNRSLFEELFDGWLEERSQVGTPVEPHAAAAFRLALFGGDFVFSVDRDSVSRILTPMLVLCGNDPYHPTSISREVAQLAPNARLVENWRKPEFQEAARRQILEFLKSHST